MLRSSLVGKGGNNELAREWKLSKLNPDLPVDAFLVEGIVLAGDTLYLAGPKVDGGLDPTDIVVVGAPEEEVVEG